MSWRDGMRFKTWYIKTKVDCALDDVCFEDDLTKSKIVKLLEEAYNKGYYDGWEGKGKYDPAWDSD